MEIYLEDPDTPTPGDIFIPVYAFVVFSLAVFRLGGIIAWPWWVILAVALAPLAFMLAAVTGIIIALVVRAAISLFKKNV